VGLAGFGNDMLRLRRQEPEELKKGGIDLCLSYQTEEKRGTPHCKSSNLRESDGGCTVRGCLNI